MVKPIPDGYHSVTPYIIVDDAKAAIEFYTRAFGATEVLRLPMGDKIGHAEIKIGDSHVMLADEFPERDIRGPRARGGTSSSLMIYVDDVDATFKRALNAGARTDGDMEVKDQFYGDRSGTLMIRSVTNGPSPPMSRMSRRTRCSGAWPNSASRPSRRSRRCERSKQSSSRARLLRRLRSSQ